MTNTSQPAQDPEEAPPPPPAILAGELTLRASRGPVYGPLDLQIPTGWLVALVGGPGSGRTSLLLTLAGRMRPTAGTLQVLGHRLPRGRRTVQAHCALACFDQVDTPDEALTMAELLRERAEITVPLWRRPMRLADPPMDDMLTTVFGESLPDPATQVWHLTPLQVAQLQVAIALIGNPQILVVDDVDDLREPAAQAAFWQTLQRVTGRGVTVVAATTSTIAIPAEMRIVRLADRQPDWVPEVEHSTTATVSPSPASRQS